jgi:predicted dehydrogenase
LEDVEFIGGADPKGDPHRALGGYPLYKELPDLLTQGVDAVVLAIPSDRHEKWALLLAEHGIHTLIEKPLASDLEAAIRIRDAFAGTETIAAVGYVERFNPALQELKRRLEAEELGRVFAITTRRVGPYPLRVRDVGVVRDLASHDVDIIHWLGCGFTTLSSELAFRLSRPFEDLVEVVGRLEDGTVVSMSVNWLTPTKERSVTVLGERGAFVADLLAADLTFYANAAVPIEWEAMARLKGVAEGDVVRYAIPKPEPLQTELQGFRDAILNRPDAQFVTVDDGVRAMAVAEMILQ